MHTYRMLVDSEDLEKHIVPVLQRNGFEIPPAGCFIAAAEFDEAGDMVAYQMLQNAVFFEGLWSRDTSSHLLTLHRMATHYAVEILKSPRVMTLTRDDEQGSRIARLAERLGFERMKWNIFRRKTCQ